MTNGDLYNLFLFLANKQQLSGYLSIPDFALELKSKNILLLRERLGLSNDYGVGQPLSRQQKGQSTLLDDQTRIFKKKGSVTFSGGVATLPSDYFRYDALLIDGAYDGVDILFGAELGTVLNSSIDYPTEEFPYATFYQDKLEVYPSTLLTGTLYYYRTPATPVFDYYIDAAAEIQYLAVGESYTLQAGETYSDGTTSGTKNSISVELEWDDDNKLDILYMIASDAGLNLMRQDVTQYAMLKKDQGK